MELLLRKQLGFGMLGMFFLLSVVSFVVSSHLPLTEKNQTIYNTKTLHYEYPSAMDVIRSLLTRNWEKSYNSEALKPFLRFLQHDHGQHEHGQHGPPANPAQNDQHGPPAQPGSSELTNGHEDHNKMNMPHEMVFNTNTDVSILFRCWTTTKEWEYVLSCAFCVLLGIISVLLKVIRFELETRLCYKEDTLNTSFFLTIPVYNNLIRMVQAFIIHTWDYLLMLIVMTYNVGIFLSICIGLSLGFLFFGHKLHYNKRGTMHLFDDKKEEMTEDYKADLACGG